MHDQGRSLDIDASCVMVLEGCGPEGLSRLRRGRQHAAPAQSLKQGITDMVRISDGRMSGTAYGAVVCTYRRKRPPAARWRSFRMAT